MASQKYQLNQKGQIVCPAGHEAGSATYRKFCGQCKKQKDQTCKEIASVGRVQGIFARM